jgi:RNA polymerase sigma-70 factor (ECF subfamily)
MRSKGGPLAEPERFGELYDSNYRALLRFFARRVLDPQLALELTAETLAQAFIRRRQFRGREEGEARAWLYAIARSQLATYYRRGARERRALDRLGIQLPAAAPDELERIEELADLAEARGSVRAGLAGLDEGQRLALRLRVVEERPYPEVARTLGVSEPTARARVSRALRALGKALDPEPTMEEPA